MLDHLTVAQLEEGRQARSLAELAPEHRLFAGGCAARGAPGTWVNNTVGVGLAGEAPAADLADLVNWFEEKHIEPRIELCPYADRSVTFALASLGFVIRDWENVLYRPIDPAAPARTISQPPADIHIEIVDPSDAARVREYAAVSMSGFFPDNTSPTEADFDLAERWTRHHSVVSVAAVIDGRYVGAGAASFGDGIVYLSGLTVLPQFRRRGIQQALIAERLNIAASRGIRVATIGSRPGAPTERNVRRMGFQLAYTKAIVVRPGPGLIPNVG